MQKLAKQDAASPAASAADNGNEPFNNPEIEAKIADYRKNHPKHVEWLKSTPRERLENIATLRDIEKQEQRERIWTATARKLDQWLAARPEEAQRINAEVAKLPKERQEAARYRMIETAIQNEAFRNTQAAAPKVGGPKV